MANRANIPRHELIRTPQGWKDQERALVVQLERIHDDIYKRFPQIDKDIAASAEAISEANEAIAGLNEDISDINGTISGINEDISGINGELTDLSAGKATLGKTSVLILKNNGTVFVPYSTLSIKDSSVYLITVIGLTNNAWRYAGILFRQSTRTLIVSLASLYIGVTVDDTGITLTNTHENYDITVDIQAIGR